MAEKELVFRVKVVDEAGAVVEKTAKSFDDLNESVSSLQKELDKTDINSEKFQQLQKELKNSEKALSQAKQATTSLGDQLGAIPGPVGQAVQGIKGLGTAFKALIANPIGAVIAAIVLALTALYKAFASTKAGAEKLDQIFAGISAAMDVLRDRVLKVGSALVKFFTGDFSGALDDAKGAVSGLGDEIAAEFQQAMKIKAELQAIDDAQRDLNKSRAEQNRLINESKLRVNDENLSYAERQKALEQVRTAEISLAKQEEELARRRYEAIKAQNALSDSSKEALDAEAEAYIALQNAQTNSLAKQKELFDQEKALRDRQRAEAKAAAEERKRQAEEVVKFEQALELSLVEDKYEKAQMVINNEKTAQLEQLKNLKVSKEKRAELELGIEQATQLKLKQLAEEKQKEDDAKAQEKLAKQKEEADKALAVRKAELDAQIELEMMKDELDLQALSERLTARMELELQNEELTESQRTLIREQYAGKIKEIDKSITDSKKKQSQERIAAEIAEVEAYAAGAQALVSIFGEETMAGKAAALAATYLNTYAGAAKALNDETIPNTFLRIVAAAAVVANGLGQVNKIMNVSTNIPKASQGGLITGVGSTTSDNIPVMVSPGEAVINANSTQMFGGLLSTINEMGGGRRFSNQVPTDTNQMAQSAIISSLSGMGDTPIKTYVVATEISNQQQLDRLEKTRSTI